MRTPVIALVVLSLLALAPSVQPQASDQLVVLTSLPEPAVLRFDRKLNLLSETPTELGSVSSMTPAGIDGRGQIWIGLGWTTTTKLLRFGPDGALASSTDLGLSPSAIAVPRRGALQVFASDLGSTGALLVVSPSGAVLGSNDEGTSLFLPQLVPTVGLTFTSASELWMLGLSVACAGCPVQPLLVHVDPDDGDVLQSVTLPVPSPYGAGEVGLAAAPDGTLWHLDSSGLLVHVEDGAIVSS